jgi:hypothetical protein
MLIYKQLVARREYLLMAVIDPGSRRRSRDE